MDIRIATAQLNLTSMLTASSGVRSADNANSPLGTSGASESSSVVDIATGGDPTGINKLLAAIESREDLYTTQLAALKGYQATIGAMGGEALKLGELTGDSSPADIKSALHAFADQYNAMVDQQAANFAKGGSFDSLDAAEYARFAMEREVGNVFNGSGKLGFGGLANAGVSIDPKTKKMVVDDAQLDSMMTKDKGAVLAGVQDLAKNFKAATDTYTEDGKFISNRISRLQDALNWIEQNKPAIEQQAAAANGSVTNTEQYKNASVAGKQAMRAYGAVSSM